MVSVNSFYFALTDEDEIKALDQKYQALLSDSRSDFENSVPLSRQSSLAESEASNAGEHTSQNAILGWPKSGDVSNSQFSTPFRPSAYSHSNQPSKPGPSTVPPTKQKRKRNRSVKTVPYDANDRTFALLNAPHISVCIIHVRLAFPSYSIDIFLICLGTHETHQTRVSRPPMDFELLFQDAREQYNSTSSYER